MESVTNKSSIRERSVFFQFFFVHFYKKTKTFFTFREHAPEKSFNLCLFVYLCAVTMLFDNKSYTIAKPLYFSLNGSTFIRKILFIG